MNLKFPLFYLVIVSFSFYSCSKDDLKSEEDLEPKNELQLDTDFLMNKERTLVNYIISNEDYDAFLKDKGDFAKVSKKVYKHFNDDFDFIFILSNEEVHPEGLYSGISYITKNDVKGVGQVLFDYTQKYGSLGGKLKSVIHMPRTEYIKNGPFLHEIIHYWGNHGFIETQVGGHWGYSSVGGQLGGFSALTNVKDNLYIGKMKGKNGFGTIANGGNSIPYSNTELYIMGLIGVGELEDIKIAKNAVKTDKPGGFTADEIITLTANDIVAKHGERMPSVANSQKEFTAITVVISRGILSDEKIELVHNDIENFSRQSEPDLSWGNTYNFWLATQKKATLDIKIPSPKN